MLWSPHNSLNRNKCTPFRTRKSTDKSGFTGLSGARGKRILLNQFKHIDRMDFVYISHIADIKDLFDLVIFYKKTSLRCDNRVL